jgi:hypothetical protein
MGFSPRGYAGFQEMGSVKPDAAQRRCEEEELVRKGTDQTP